MLLVPLFMIKVTATKIIKFTARQMHYNTVPALRNPLNPFVFKPIGHLKN